MGFPARFQSEVFGMAETARSENKTLYDRLKEENKNNMAVIKKSTFQADEIEKYAHYLNCVITAMNNSMSIKAKTQIEIFNLVTEVGNCQYKMERLPQKFEIWKYNADEDKKVLDFCTEEVKEEIDKVSDSIKIAVEAITAVYNQQVDLNSTHESKINAFQKTKNGITRLKGKLARISSDRKIGE